METVNIAIFGWAGSIVLTTLIFVFFVIRRIKFFIFERKVLLNPGFAEAFVSLVKTYNTYLCLTFSKSDFSGKSPKFFNYGISSLYLNLADSIYNRMLIFLELEDDWESFSRKFNYVYTTLCYVHGDKKTLKFQDEWNMSILFIHTNHLNRAIEGKAFILFQSYFLSLINRQDVNINKIDSVVEFIVRDIDRHERYCLSLLDIKHLFFHFQNKIIHKVKTCFISDLKDKDSEQIVNICDRYLLCSLFEYGTMHMYADLHSSIIRTKDDSLISIIKKQKSGEEIQKLSSLVSDKKRLNILNVSVN